MSRTRLDAINTCLRGIGLAPVATEDDPDLDAATASQVIDQITMDMQASGWWFNKESNWKLSPDETTGYIDAPSSALSIVTTGMSRCVGLSIRGTKIYDLHNHTFDLRERAIEDSGSTTPYIEFVFITELPFADLPPIARQAVTYTARRIFAQDLEIDENRWKFQVEDERVAMIRLAREDARNRKRNYLRDNAEVNYFLSRVGGQNSSSPYAGVFPKRVQY
jgi:hypothetical protein